ncbi:MAG TPA: response regulator, partial [Holophaga sp.]|nr:response regulator [Holophaga sp.]
MDAPRILVVDDVPIIRLALRRILEPEGYVCIEASDGDDALAILDQDPLPLVLCDIHMPRCSGLMVVEA